jgi:ABC-2 type transport system ATP-binding protein
VAVIRDGRIARVLDPRDLINLAVRRVRVRFREPLPGGALVGVFGATLIDRDGDSATIQIEGEMDHLIKALAAYHVIDLETERPSLEEVFLTLYE